VSRFRISISGDARPVEPVDYAVEGAPDRIRAQRPRLLSALEAVAAARQARRLRARLRYSAAVPSALYSGSISVQSNSRTSGGVTGAGFQPGQSGNPGGRPKGLACSVSAPYRADAYIEGLTGSAPPATLRGIVTRTGLILRTSSGAPVTALEAGRYTVLVRDGSSGKDFHLVGPGVDRHTGLAFTGKVSWSIELKRGTYRYRSDRPRAAAHRFVVLSPG
jgi:hypothetical protein